MAPKITGGSLGSRKLRSPKGTQVRPTPGRVKESLFSIVMHRLEGARVLDLFAGTGAIGFEAASRGAGRVVAVEAQRDVANVIEEAAKSLGVDDVVTVFQAPAERALYRLEGPFDIVYLDPPYADPVPLALFRLLLERELLAPDALVVYEHAAKRILPDIPGYRSVREEVYGDVALAFLSPES
ncbi:MAG TPA: 16S rRNA (guanine(966)-N(2))-methyltransferase RsmD [Candidatus Cybelea sp.]|jgi:16S rRNA (guanine966-N2)-methyltransferase|nr:16S rRNA (guanine(966)-N(2))-methyltransferase RsmD [Candidatus Cybelea sp.]